MRHEDIARVLSTALFASLAACSGAPPSDEAPATEGEELVAAFTCNLTNGAGSPDPSGDGEPVRITLRRRSNDSELLDVAMLGAFDLANPPSRGLPRECTRVAGITTEDVYVCRAEPEWTRFETTSTLRLPAKAIKGGAAFPLTYHSARDDRRTKHGFRESSASRRLFQCER